MSSSQKATGEEGWPVKFVPFASVIDSPFWVKCCQEKLERIQLSEEGIDFRPTYSVDAPPRLQVHESSLHCCSDTASATASVVPNERVSVAGKLIGFNTVEKLQKVDKNELLRDYFCPKFLKGNTDCLASTILLTYADLKNHKILYWFGFPALMTQPGKSIRATRQEKLDENEYPKLASQIDFMRRSLAMDGYKGLPPYFIFSNQSCLPLSVESFSSIRAETDGIDGVVFGFFDPVRTSPTTGTTEQKETQLGWPMRNLIAYLCFHLGLGGQNVKILSYRPHSLRRLTVDEGRSTSDAEHSSILLTVQVPVKEDYARTDSSGDDQYQVVGWELNARAKPGPRWVNLRPLLDAKHLAIQAADLNLKLMKWRMIPDLKVEVLQSTKVLIIGAGTLGCSVSRVLLGWGVRDFKIVDSGRVSYSNPARQNLFTLEDCHDKNGSGRPKAVAAAEALQTIAADVNSEGIILSIPMPGHTESRESVQESVEALDKLVEECDVVFLLTDTRESRWLPTVMAAAHDKPCLNAALGLDSWLVMRHGGGTSSCQNRLGCYFCNDVVAPENSTRNRTLDQQCTVTRPGLAPIASSMAVELMVSMLHHPDGVSAAAPSTSSSNFSPTVSNSESPLGVVPHQIRGSLVSYTMMTPTVPAFSHCTGCSVPVVDAYIKDKIKLVLSTCQSPDGSYLEDISGLTAFRADAAEKMADIEDWDDDE